MDRFWKYKLDHVIFWIATVSFHMFTRLSLVTTAGITQFILEIIVRNGLLACVVYLNLLVLIPRFARVQKVISYALLLFISLMGYAFAKNIHDVYLNGFILHDVAHQHFFHNTFYNLSIALFYVAFGVALQLSREYYAQRDVIRKIEIEKLNTELEYLKAQINPHFIFNSINTIYFQIDKKNSQARETLSAFSEMLRYQLYECNGREIQVEKEVGYLKNYVELQRMRKDENYIITFLPGNDLQGFAIAPLMLIPFVENAFKHVSHFPTNNEVRVELWREGDLFQFKVFNTRDSKAAKNGMGGIGLRNVQRRLELIYNGRHTLHFNTNPESYEVHLTLKIV